MPRRFVFKLQPVLEQREREEEREQFNVAAVERQRVAAEDKLRAIQVEFDENRSGLRERLTDPAGKAAVTQAAGMAGVRGLATESLHLTLRAQRAAMELAGVLKRLDAARSELLRATAARKAVAMLKEKALAEHRREAQRREAAELDELVVMRHGRTSLVGSNVP